MPLQITITDTSRVVWTGPYEEFEQANKQAMSAEEFAELFDHGEISIGGGAAPLLTVTLFETDHATA